MTTRSNGADPDYAWDVDVGPVWNGSHATEVARKYMQDHPEVVWTGRWCTTVWCRMSVIILKRRRTNSFCVPIPHGGPEYRFWVGVLRYLQTCALWYPAAAPEEFSRKIEERSPGGILTPADFQEIFPINSGVYDYQSAVQWMREALRRDGQDTPNRPWPNHIVGHLKDVLVDRLNEKPLAGFGTQEAKLFDWWLALAVDVSLERSATTDDAIAGLFSKEVVPAIKSALAE